MLVGATGQPQQGGACLACINASTGVTQWSFACQDPTTGQVSAAFQGAVVSARDGAVFFSSATTLYALEPTDARRWLTRLTLPSGDSSDGFLTAPALSADGFTVFVGSAASASSPSTLYALDNGSGAVLWSLRAPASVTGVAAGLTGGVAFSSADASLRFASEAGALQWATAYSPRAWPAAAPSAPALAPSGALLALTSAGSLVSFNATDGNATAVDGALPGVSAWPLGSAPVADAGTLWVYVAAPTGELRAYAP